MCGLIMGGRDGETPTKGDGPEGEASGRVAVGGFVGGETRTGDEGSKGEASVGSSR